MGPENGQNIADLIAQQATAEPDKIALIDGERHLSFTQLNQQQGQWAQLFSTSDFVTGDRVGLCLRDSADFVVALLGAAQAGLTILPMDFRAPLAARADLASRFSLAGLVTEPGSPTPDNVRCLQLDEPLQARLRASAPMASCTADQSLLFIKLSSGTTGPPKGALITHDQFILRMQRHRQRYGNLANGRYLSATPLHFTGGHSHVLFQLMNGNTVILYPPLFAAEELIDAVREHAANILFLVPTVLRWLMDQPANKALLFPDLKSLTTSAGPMTGEEKRRAARRLSPQLYQGYATSAAGQISCLLPEDLVEHAESVGKPHADLDIEIIGPEGQALPPGATGILRCRGQAVSTAYFHEDDSDAAERFEDGWCYTGDLASLDDQGYFLKTEQLKERFDILLEGIPAENVVFYCGSGVTASHNIIAMIEAGYEMPKLYPGSWSEWITDPTRPVGP